MQPSRRDNEIQERRRGEEGAIHGHSPTVEHDVDGMDKPNAALVAATDCPEMSTVAIAQAINALVKKFEQAQEKAEQYERTMGHHLKELKERKPDDIDWEAWLEKCGVNLKQDRADQLIRVADGRTTIEKVRADAAERNRQLRARKSLSRDSEPAADLVPAAALQPAQQPGLDPSASVEISTACSATQEAGRREPIEAAPAPAVLVDADTALLQVKKCVQDYEHRVFADERKRFQQALRDWAQENFAEAKRAERRAERDAKKATKWATHLARTTAHMSEPEKVEVYAADVAVREAFAAYEATVAELDTVFGRIYGGGVYLFSGECEKGRLAWLRVRHSKRVLYSLLDGERPPQPSRALAELETAVASVEQKKAADFAAWVADNPRGTYEDFKAQVEAKHQAALDEQEAAELEEIRRSAAEWDRREGKSARGEPAEPVREGSDPLAEVSLSEA
jgi:hypothetical protein